MISLPNGERGFRRDMSQKTSPDGPIVRFVDVQKSFDGATLVVKNLNLDIAKGEFLTLLGPSGSGKTTTLLMLAGFEAATHGEIYLKSAPINRVPPHKRGIGMVFQNYALFPHMTVNENLAFPLQVRGKSKAEIEERIRRVLAMVELPAFGHRRPSQLSGGQQQRIAVARALVFDPDLVLMDEPLGALDKQLREQMQYEIRKLHERLAITVVYVTHDQAEALTMSDRIAVFNDGEVQQLSTPDELYERPQNSFVAQFIGENNRLKGTVEEMDGNGTCIVRLDSGDRVTASAVKVAKKGDRTLLSLRPERVEINPEQGGLANIVEGRIEELIYLGDHLRTRLSVAGHPDFIVKIPNKSGIGALSAGTKVRIGWSERDCRALDDD
jgi:putative spermidine/putrescine transport system ATP-binding protein